MDNIANKDDPGDCQQSTGSSNENIPLQSDENHLNTTNKSNTTADKTAKQNATNAAAAGKFKTNQQQQQLYQFRAPQQFVKHKKSAAAGHSKSCATTAGSLQNPLGIKKQKCWNKRQHKVAKNQNNNNANIATIAEALANAIGSANAAEEQNNEHGSSGSTQASNKADLENIQNIKNEIGGPQQQNHQQQQQHSHQQHHQHHHGGSANLFPPCLNVNNDKLLYAHLGQKQQLQHKKLLSSHRGGHQHNNHHHVLCAGSAHNTQSGGGGNNSIVSASTLANISCCHINGCASHMGKDNSSSAGSNSAVNNSTLHFCCLRSKFFLPDKRPPRKGNFIPPTKFLLGGNISDPLNLSSLQNEASNASSNHTTPRQSPITTPPKVEVIIPPNIHDPLHLLDPVDSMEYEKQLTSPMKRGGVLLGGLTSLALSGLRGSLTLSKAHKHRHRNKRKPKRKRNDSYNSTTSTVADSLEEEQQQQFAFAKGNDSAMLLATAAAETGSANSTAAAGLELKSAQASETTAAAAAATIAAAVVGNQQPADDLTLQTHNEQASAAETAAAAVLQAKQDITEMAATKTAGLDLGQTKERPCRDLRLDLISTTASNNASCSIYSSLGNFAGGRKRKISESNSSQKSKKHFRIDSMDKIVSPVVPQPGAWKRPPRTTASGARKSISRRSTSISESIATDLSPLEETSKQLVEDTTKIGPLLEPLMDAGSPLSNISATTSVNTADQDANSDLNSDNSNALNLAENVKNELALVKQGKSPLPKFTPDGGKYRYGNFDRYAGLRHLNEFLDVRLHVFLQYPELFKSKDVLDIGCNVGHMTIAVASKLAPKSILGIDIDKDLVARARRNLTMYVRLPFEVRKKESERLEETKDAAAAAGHIKKGRRRRRKKKSHGINMENQQQQQSQQHQHHHQHINFNHWQHFHSHFVHYHLHHHHRLQEELNVQPDEFFPISFPLTYGAIAKPNGCNAKASASPHNLESQSPASSSTTTRSTPGHAAAAGSQRANTSNNNNCLSLTSKTALFRPKNDFPNNVFFRQTNYVLKDESLLANDTQQYDLILCLSVTKWIHLNFGDVGLKLAFKRMFNQLRPGGKLILEAQNWASYKKKKNLTEDIYNNYNNIEFFPNKFHEYLLSSEVGFSHSYSLGVPKHLSKGFSRPIQLYAKGDYTPNHVRWSDAYYPQTPFEAYKGIYATMPPRPTGLQSSYPIISSTRSQNYDTPSYYAGGGGGGTSAPYSCRQTPMHQPSTSQYYNPLESDSYQPSYDMEYLNHMYVFASPLYQTVWSPPTSMRKSSSHTPVFGSVRDPEFEGTSGSCQRRHVYPPNEDTCSPNANAGNAFNSIRDPDTDDSNQHRPHVYATNCGEAGTSPHPSMETLDDALIIYDEQQQQQQQSTQAAAPMPNKSSNCDSSEA